MLNFLELKLTFERKKGVNLNNYLPSFVIVLRRLYVLSFNHFRDQHGGRTWFLKTANNVSREI